MLRHALIGAGLLAATVPATANDAVKTLGAFYDTCLAQGPSFERTKPTATLFKWKPLPPEALTMFAPTQTPDLFEGWLVNSEGYPKNTIVAVTMGRLDGRPVLTCTMAVSGVNGNDVERLFLDRLAPRKTGEQSNGMQEIRFYRLTTGVQEAEQLVIVSGAAPEMLNLSSYSRPMMDDPKR